MSRKGQMLLLAVIILAFSIIHALSYLRKPAPIFVEYRGELQSAELIHVARLYWSNSHVSMDSLLSLLKSLAERNKVYIPIVSYANNHTIIAGFTGYGFYHTEYNVSVIFDARWRWSFKGYYIKDLYSEKLLYKSFIIKYYHNYTAPQWGSIIVYPTIGDPAKICDIVYSGNGVWIVGYPAYYNEYIFVDEYGLKLVIKE